MTVFLRWLLLPLIALIVLLFWKGSPLLIKIALLIIPLTVIIGWFVHEGGFVRGGGLATVYGLLAVIAFLICYEIGLLINRYYLVKKSISTVQDDILLFIGLGILIITVIYFLVKLSD